MERVRVGPVEMLDVNVEADRARIARAIAEASDVATAVSSVNDYVTAGPASTHLLLAEGLRRKAVAGGLERWSMRRKTTRKRQRY